MKINRRQALAAGGALLSSFVLPARAQGKTRYQRGLNVYKVATNVALDKGWSCNWRLIVLPGVGHSARKMFASKQAVDALLP